MGGTDTRCQCIATATTTPNTPREHGRHKTHSNPNHEHIPETHCPQSNASIKHEGVPGIFQRDEARGKVIPEERLRAGRSGRSCDHPIGLLVQIIHNMPHLIHLDPISYPTNMIERR